MRRECTKRRSVGNPESHLRRELGALVHVFGVSRFIRELLWLADAAQMGGAPDVWMRR